jgi:formamidopyrimidine-DNA glycosylase
VGRRIRSTERHGKHLIATLDDGSTLILHFGMTGTIETSAQDAAPPQYEVLHIGLGKDRWASVTSRRKLAHIWLTGDVGTFLRDHGQGPARATP